MSLYRQPGQIRRRRRLLAAGVAAVVALIVAVVVLVGGGGGEPTRADRVQAARTAAADALDGLEVLRIHYPQAVPGGQVADAALYASTKANVARTRGDLRAHATDLAAIDPRAPRTVDAALARVATAVDGRAGVPAFENAVRAAAAPLGALAAGRSPVGAGG